VILQSVNILHLSEAERLALQKLALSKLQAMDLACPIVIPKGERRKRRVCGGGCGDYKNDDDDSGGDEDRVV
jgi:hypothetical protein